MNAALKKLQEKIGYDFHETKLLEAALTHSSTGSHTNYERLEFLGDRVLGLVMAETVYAMFPRESEGDLAKRHAALVQGAMLAELARHIDLGAALQISEAERIGGGTENENILADGLEALIGAIYLDSGLAPCQKFIKGLWGERVKTMKDPPQDSKTALQEWAQARGFPLPSYEVVKREGPDHAPVFHVEVAVGQWPPQKAIGSSIRAAEKEAAQLLLEYLRKDAT